MSKAQRRWLGAAVTIAAGLALAGSIPEAATAAPPHCGSHVTRDVILHANLTGCRSSGLVIAADGVTVDLNGHTIRGRGRAGIDNTAGHDRVTVKSSGARALLDGYLDAVAISHGKSNVVRNVEGFEISVSRSSRGVIAHNQLLEGVFLSRAHRLRLVENAITGLSTATVQVSDSSKIVVKNNDIFHGHRGIWFVNTDHSRVLGNRVNMADEPAIWLTRRSDHNLVAGNRVYQFFAGGFGGIDVQVSSRNRVVHNVIRGDIYGWGIATGQPDSFFARAFGRGISRNNVIKENTVRGANIGILADGGSSADTVIKRNAAKLGGQGIRAGSASSSLADNLVKKNEGHGISAIRGVENLGGNVAIRNKGRPQCVHLHCRTIPPGT